MGLSKYDIGLINEDGSYTKKLINRKKVNECDLFTQEDDGTFILRWLARNKKLVYFPYGTWEPFQKIISEIKTKMGKVNA